MRLYVCVYIYIYHLIVITIEYIIHLINKVCLVFLSFNKYKMISINT